MLKVIWSENAKNELFDIVQFWNNKNQSTAYTDKLIFHIEIGINLIKNNPNLGVKSNFENVRMRLILKNYYLIYEFKDSKVVILQFWDVRLNPLNFKF